MSDRVVGESLETRMDDVRAVMDAAGSTRAALFGILDGAAMSMLFAATYPERTSALVLLGSFPRTRWAADYPWGATTEQHDAVTEQLHAPLLRLPDEAAEVVRLFGERSRATTTSSRTSIISAAPVRVPEHPARVPGGVRRDRRQAGTAGDPGPDTAHPRHRGAALPDRRRAVHGPADPRCEAARATRRTDHPGRSRSRQRARRDGGVPDGGLEVGRLGGARAGPGAGNDPVHGHRRLDRARGGAGRPGLARAAGTPSRGGASPAGSFPGHRGEHGGRRLLRQLRRAGAGDPLRQRDRRLAYGSSGSRFAPACTRGSASSSTARCPASPCTPAHGSPPKPARARCSCRAPSRTSSPARGSRSRIAAPTS